MAAAEVRSASSRGLIRSTTSRPVSGAGTLPGRRFVKEGGAGRDGDSGASRSVESAQLCCFSSMATDHGLYGVPAPTKGRNGS